MTLQKHILLKFWTQEKESKEKKKSETTLQQEEMDESHPKFIEMQKQIQCLPTEIKHLKTCNT